MNVEPITLEKGSYRKYRKIEEGIKALSDISYELTGVKNLSGHLAFEVIPSISAGVTTLEGIQIEKIELRDAMKKYDNKRGVDEIKELLKIGINAMDMGHNGNGIGMTSVMRASLYGYTDLVIALILKGADIDIQQRNSDNGYTALIYAASNGYADVVEILIASGADVNITYYKGSALLEAIKEGHTGIAMTLIKAGADVNAIYSEGTALEVALKKANIEFVRSLIEAGADVNKQNNDGETALLAIVGLSYSSYKVKLERVTLLLESGLM